MATTYTVPLVERILRNYLDVRGMLLGVAQARAVNPTLLAPPSRDPRRTPLGMGPNELRPWPMMEPHEAREPRDGKARARRREELHAAVVDIDLALEAVDDDGYPRVGDEDRWLILNYYVYQNYTLEELCAMRGVVSRGSMLRRCQRAVARLVAELERPK